MEPTTYYGWAKPTGSGQWTRIDATASTKKADCYDLLMAHTELAGGWQGGDLAILPEGRTPLQSNVTATYRDRMMRPQRWRRLH